MWEQAGYTAYAGYRREETNKMTNGKTKKHLAGVMCDAKQCAYHDGESNCSAPRISIGPGYASRAGETVCATFRKKER